VCPNRVSVRRLAACPTQSVQPRSVANRRFWFGKYSAKSCHRIKIGLIFLLLFLSRKKVNKDFKTKAGTEINKPPFSGVCVPASSGQRLLPTARRPL